MSWQQANTYTSYEYKEIPVPYKDVSLFLDCYESFGWKMDDNRPANRVGRTVTLYLKRDRKIINKMELTRLQRNFESCIREIELLERSKVQVPAMWAILIGIIGTFFMAGSVFSVTHEPPRYLLMTLLSIPAFIGWTLPFFLYRRLVQAKIRTVQPLIEAKYEEIYQLCEKGHSLL